MQAFSLSLFLPLSLQSPAQLEGSVFIKFSLDSEISPDSNLNFLDEGMRMVADQMSHFIGIPQYHSQSDQNLCIGDRVGALEAVDHPPEFLLGFIITCWQLLTDTELSTLVEWIDISPQPLPTQVMQGVLWMRKPQKFHYTNFMIRFQFYTTSLFML